MSVEDPMFRDMQEYNRERDERDNERADRKHRENPPAEPNCTCGYPLAEHEDGYLVRVRRNGEWIEHCTNYRPPTTEPSEGEPPTSNCGRCGRPTWLWNQPQPAPNFATLARLFIAPACPYSHTQTMEGDPKAWNRMLHLVLLFTL